MFRNYVLTAPNSTEGLSRTKETALRETDEKNIASTTTEVTKCPTVAKLLNFAISTSAKVVRFIAPALPFPSRLRASCYFATCKRKKNAEIAISYIRRLTLHYGLRFSNSDISFRRHYRYYKISRKDRQTSKI